MEEVLQRIEKYRRKLIDVSKRNPLFSFKFKEKSKTHIGIIDEIPDFVLTKLGQGKELTFEYIPNPNDIPKNELTDKYYEILEKERITNKDYISKIQDETLTNKEKIIIENELINKARLKSGFKRIIFEESSNIQHLAQKHSINPSYNLPYIYADNIVSRKHSDNKLQTFLFREDLNNKLHAIYNKSTNILKETGVGSLYIIYGNLKWYEDNDLDKPIHTPVLLQEVEISMFLKGNEYVYTIKALEESPTLNLVLHQKLKDHKILIPSFEDGKEINEYFKSTKKIINERHPNWDIINNITVAIISSTNLILYNDLRLDAEDFNNNESQFTLFKDVLGFGEECTYEISDINHDELLGSADMPLLITDTDGSQFSAINAAINNDHNVIIQGPPGTGKSQTICNIISAALNNNKTVLFIAEKLAALKVVKSRLDQMKIGDFCLEIHSNKIKKTDIVNSLRNRFLLKEESSYLATEFSLNQYIELVKNINAYSELTNSYNSLFGNSYFNLIWKYIKLSDSLKYSSKTDYKIKIKLIKLTSKFDIDTIEAVLIEYKLLKNKFLLKYKKDSKNIWNNFVINKKFQKSEDEIIRIIRDMSFDAQEIINSDTIYDASTSVTQLEADLRIINTILDLIESTNCDINLFFKFNELNSEFNKLKSFVNSWKKSGDFLTSRFNFSKLSNDFFDNIISICSSSKLNRIELKTLKEINEIIKSYLEAKLTVINHSEIENIANYVDHDLSHFKYQKSISNLLELIKCENDLKKNYLLNDSFGITNTINNDTLKLINNSSCKNFNLHEIVSVLKQLNLSKNDIGSVFSNIEKVSNLISEKIYYSFSDLEDICNIAKISEEYEEEFKLFWINEIRESDLPKIKQIQNNVNHITDTYSKISGILTLSSLEVYSVDELSQYVKDYKEKGLLKFFSRSYWKLRNLNKYLSPEVELLAFVGLLEEYIVSKNSENKIKTDVFFISVFGQQDSIFDANIPLLIETTLYKEKINNVSFKNTNNALITAFLLESEHKHILDLCNILKFFNSASYENITKQLEIFKLDNIEELLELISREVKDLEHITSIYTNLNIKPDVICSDLLIINRKLEQLYVLNENYSKDASLLKICSEMVDDLFAKANDVLVADKISISDIHESKRYFNDNDVSRNNIESSLINSLIKIDIDHLDPCLEKLNSIYSIIVIIENSHKQLCCHLKKGDVDYIQTKTLIEKHFDKTKKYYSSFEKLQSDSIIDLQSQFETKDLNSLSLNLIKEYFDHLLNDITGYSDYIRYNEILEIVNKYELNNFLLDFSRNKYDINSIEQYFVLFALSTCIDEFWFRNKNLFIENDISFENSIEKFRKADKDYLIANRTILKNKLIKRSVNDVGEKNYHQEKNRLVSQKVGFDLINNEISKQARHIPIRSLFQRAGEEVLFYKPCLMMSPQSVSQFLPKENFSFDIIVIDEASQIKPERCLASLIRGKQLVVVGDSKQLPPTFDMTKSLDDEDIINEDNSIEENEEEIEESILELVNGTVRSNYMLTWHYRSKDPTLINFSNVKFYNEDLIVFPSPILNSDFGITHYYLEEAVYKNNCNELEAETIVNKLIELLSSDSSDTIGVVAVNQKQSTLIDELLFKRIGSSPLRDVLFEKATGGDDPLIIKNLENIQGDERDIILISTVYGKDDSGKFYQRFGPINSKFGHRRLNVLFTRARKKILLYTSMRSEDINDDNKNLGVKILKEYLEYSKTGILQTSEKTNKGVDSEFEYSVKQMLESNGYIVDTQIGVKGFFVDLAIRDNSSSRYLLGIECDGAPYHSELSARERDRLRQEILEGLGWTIYRILSTDWYQNYEREKAKLLQYLKIIKN